MAEHDDDSDDNNSLSTAIGTKKKKNTKCEILPLLLCSYCIVCIVVAALVTIFIIFLRYKLHTHVSVLVCVGVIADLATDSLEFSVKPAPSHIISMHDFCL